MKKCKYSDLYLPHDEYIIFNENVAFPEQEQELVPIKYKLPTPPPLDKIDGWGLPPEEQFFAAFKPIIPPKLAKLNRELGRYPSEKLNEIETNPDYYSEEIKFITREFDRRKKGYWFFNKGKPTFITRDHYFYLVYYFMEGRSPDFRKRDRIHYLFDKFCEEDKNCYGHNYPKMRREGATHRKSAKRLNRVTLTPHYKTGLQSKNKDHAEEIHLINIIESFKKLPFFFVPVWDNNSRSTSSIKFFAPTTKEHPDTGRNDCLESIIDYKDAGNNAYDGLPLNDLHNDECGKVSDGDVYERWQIQKLCLFDNGLKRGEAWNTSTVNEMEWQGGMNFKRLADHSHYHRPPNGKDLLGNDIPGRNDLGETITGLYNLFIPSYEGLVIYDKTGKCSVDKYGDTDIKMTIGYLKGKLEDYRKTNDQAAFIEQCRLFPLRWSDCWRMSAKDCNFNQALLEERIEYFRQNGNNLKVRGDFEWDGDVRDSKVIFKPTPAGRFWVSFLFDNPVDSNKYFMEGGVRIPANTLLFVAGADPYKNKTKHAPNAIKNGRSNGGGVVYMKHNPITDPDTKPRLEWKTDRFIVTYSYRHPTQEEYGEDMIKMCVYYGCKLNPEMNVDFLKTYFRNRGYGGYLHHMMSKRGDVSLDPGKDTGVKIQETIYNLYRSYIENNCLRDAHDELLQDCLMILDDMGPFDRFVAGGYALMAARETPIAVVEQMARWDVDEIYGGEPKEENKFKLN